MVIELVEIRVIVVQKVIHTKKRLQAEKPVNCCVLKWDMQELNLRPHVCETCALNLLS